MRDVVTTVVEVAGMLMICAAAACAVAALWALVVFFGLGGVVVGAVGVLEGRK